MDGAVFCCYDEQHIATPCFFHESFLPPLTYMGIYCIIIIACYEKVVKILQEIPHISFYMKVLLHQFQHERTEVLSRLGLTASQTDVLLYVAMSPVGNICQRDIEHFFHLSNPR